MPAGENAANNELQPRAQDTTFKCNGPAFSIHTILASQPADGYARNARRRFIVASIITACSGSDGGSLANLGSPTPMEGVLSTCGARRQSSTQSSWETVATAMPLVLSALANACLSHPNGRYDHEDANYTDPSRSRSIAQDSVHCRHNTP